MLINKTGLLQLPYFTSELEASENDLLNVVECLKIFSNR